MVIPLKLLGISAYQLHFLKTLIVFMIFHFSIRFSFGGMPPQIWPAVYGGIAIIGLFQCRRSVRRLMKGVDASGALKAAIYLHILAVIWALIVIFFRNGEFSYYKELIMSLWYGIIIYFYLFVYIYEKIHTKNMVIAFMKFYLYAQGLYILFSALFILFPSIKAVWIPFIAMPDLAGQLFSQTVTRIGLKGFSSFGETIRCSIGVLFCLYLIAYQKIKYSIILGIMLVGNMFYGRSGLIFSIAAIVFYCIKRISVRRLGLFVLLGIFMACAVYGLLEMAEGNERAAYAANWMLNPFVTVYANWQQGKFSIGRSGDILLQKMYFMPQSDLTLFFGDGQFSVPGGKYYMSTDAGPMRHMLFYGLVGELLGYMSFGCLLWNLKRLFMRNKDYIGSGFCTSFLFLALFFEIKGECYFSFFGIIFALCLGTKCENKNGNTSLNC